MTTDITPAWVVELLVKATLWLILACLAAWGLRRASAARRHLVWTAGLAGLLLLPVLSLVAPTWALPWPERPSEPLAASKATPAAGKPAPREADQLLSWLFTRPSVVNDGGSGVAPSVAKSNDAPAATKNSESAPVPDAAASHEDTAPSAWRLVDQLPSLLATFWAVGAAFMLLWIALSACVLERLRRRATTVTSGTLFERTTALAEEVGVGPITLLVTAERTIPMTWGFRRAKVLLPAQAESWSTERLRLVLLHELGHVRRRDCLTQLIGLAARALFWFHPLAWVALKRQRAEAEQASDDFVLAHGAEAPTYAEHLLAITANLPANYFASPVALGMARSAAISRRLVALLDASKSRRPWSRLGLGLFAGVALAILTLAAMGSWARQAEAQTSMPDVRGVAVSLTPVDGPDGIAPAPADKEATECECEGDKPDDKDGKKVDVHALWKEISMKLKETYVGPLDEEKLIHAALKGLLESLKDPYTDYLPASELKAFDAATRGIFAGVGAQLKLEGDKVVVVTPIENSPAHKGGIRPGDVLESVDGDPLKGVPLAKAVEKIIGPKGTKVKLKVLHADGESEELTLTRDLISIASVEGFRRDAEGRWIWWLDPKEKIGYVHIMQFSPRTSKELSAALAALEKEGLKGLVLDLRFCPGGLLEQALAVCRLFLDKGTIVSIKGPGKEERTFEAEGKAPHKALPLVVVVNEATASAAEIVAGALRDNERAIILGGRTFGKGSVQQLVNLDAGGALKVTTAHHFLPSGRNIQKRPGEKVWGVDPNEGFFVLLSEAQTEALRKDGTRRALLGFKKGEAPKFTENLTPKVLETDYSDPQLGAALRTMTAKLTGGDFVKVGKNTAEVQEQLLRLDDLRQKRENLMKSLKSLEAEIQELQKLAK